MHMRMAMHMRTDTDTDTGHGHGTRTRTCVLHTCMQVVYAELMAMVAASPVLAEDTLVVIEYPVELGCFPPTLVDGRLVGLRNRRYGRTVLAVYVYRPTGRLDIRPYTEEFVSL